MRKFNWFRRRNKKSSTSISLFFHLKRAVVVVVVEPTPIGRRQPSLEHADFFSCAGGWLAPLLTVPKTMVFRGNSQKLLLVAVDSFFFVVVDDANYMSLLLLLHVEMILLKKKFFFFTPVKISSPFAVNTLILVKIFNTSLPFLYLLVFSLNFPLCFYDLRLLVLNDTCSTRLPRAYPFKDWMATTASS